MSREWNGFVSDTLANRPAAALVNRFYFATDDNGGTLYRDTGSVWQQIAGGLTFAVPSGAILMWSGLLTAIPTGWALCDGAGGRPDLRQRFVVGAAAGINPGGTGGSANTSSAGGHTHDAHSGSSARATTSITIAASGAGSAHSHTNTSPTGQTTTGITIGASGAGSSHDHTGSATHADHTHAFTQSSNAATPDLVQLNTATSGVAASGTTGNPSATLTHGNTGAEATHTHASGAITEPNAGAGHSHTVTSPTGNESAHTHASGAITEPNAGAGHSHAVTVSPVTHSSDGAHTHTATPAYYEIAYIIKL